MKFIYSPDKDEMIISHEEKMLKEYSDIVHSYKSKFEQYNCSLVMGCGWMNLLKKKHPNPPYRLPFKNGYAHYIYFQVERNGKTVRYEDKTGEYDFYELAASWIVSHISRCFLHLNVFLSTDTNDVIEEIEELLETTKNLYNSGEMDSYYKNH